MVEQIIFIYCLIKTLLHLLILKFNSNNFFKNVIKKTMILTGFFMCH